MAVLKHTSPTASVAAPKPRPSKTVPSASTRSAVARKSAPAGWAAAGDSISLIGKASDSAENRDEGAEGQARQNAYWTAGVLARIRLPQSFGARDTLSRQDRAA